MARTIDNELVTALTQELIDLKKEKKQYDKEMNEKIKDVQTRIEKEVTN